MAAPTPKARRGLIRIEGGSSTPPGDAWGAIEERRSMLDVQLLGFFGALHDEAEARATHPSPSAR